MARSIAPSRSWISATLAAFATFGTFWGVWGASIPRVRDRAGVSEGELGLALLFVGAGALPAMLLAGRAVDRFGLRVCAWLILALGLAGVGMVLAAHGLMSLSIGLAIAGAASGAADVAMNAIAGRAEQLAERPVITRAHGILSGFVVLGSLAVAAVAALELPVVVPFVAVAAMGAGAAVAMLRVLPGREEHAAPDEGVAAGSVAAGASIPLLLIGVLGALAFASESAHQNWSALFARDVLDASHGTAALAPALFATVVSISRLTVGRHGSTHPRATLLAGGIAAATGSLVVSIANGPALFALGLVIAAAGTAVLFPTVIGLVSRTVTESRRGRATSLVTTVSYLGFLLGPAYVGAWAGAYDLRVAMVAVAAVALSLALLTPALLRAGGIAPRA